MERLKLIIKNIYERVFNNRITTLLGALLIVSAIGFHLIDKDMAATGILTAGITLIGMKDEQIIK